MRDDITACSATLSRPLCIQTASAFFPEASDITAFQVGSQTDTFHERYISVSAKSLVIATGCIERPLLFADNDRPGIMQTACAHRLARTYGLLAGEQAVFGIGDV